MIFDTYLPYDEQGHMTKCFWRSSQKHFVKKLDVTGRHYYLDNIGTNEEICKRTAEWLYGIIRDVVPKQYHVDTRAFDIINPNVDYLSLLQK